jgi:predicted permease
LGIIPVIFVIMTCVSWGCSTLVSRIFGFHRRARNFVTAMGVFGNSNSLPISLVIAFSSTLSGLHWDRIPGDNDDDVSARGILYLLIFQQLGLLLRWSWGFNVLLAPKDTYEEYRDDLLEQGSGDGPEATNDQAGVCDDCDDRDACSDTARQMYRDDSVDDFGRYWPEGRTPVAGGSRASPAESDQEWDDQDSDAESHYPKPSHRHLNDPAPDPTIGTRDRVSSDMVSSIRDSVDSHGPDHLTSFRVAWKKNVRTPKPTTTPTEEDVPSPLPSFLRRFGSGVSLIATKTYAFLNSFMNPPLWAMVVAIVVASIPSLQAMFFNEGSFVNRSVTRAIQSCGSVAVPLILVVLGANLGRNTQSGSDGDGVVDPEEAEIGTKLLVASLLSRMLLPTLIMAPVLALFAKYVPVSILDDPIFVIVCFLLTGAPTALQLAQICQMNRVYEGVMGRILFQSYVIW